MNVEVEGRGFCPFSIQGQVKGCVYAALVLTEQVQLRGRGTGELV